MKGRNKMWWQRSVDPHLYLQQVDRVLTRWNDTVLDFSDVMRACVLRQRQNSQDAGQQDKGKVKERSA